MSSSRLRSCHIEALESLHRIFRTLCIFAILFFLRTLFAIASILG